MEIRHIGKFGSSICSNKETRSLREDLGSERYKRLGIDELFKDEKPYRICKKCIAIIEAREGALPKVEVKV